MTTISRSEDGTEYGNSKGTAELPHTLHGGRADPAAFDIKRSHGEVHAIRQRTVDPDAYDHIPHYEVCRRQGCGRGSSQAARNGQDDEADRNHRPIVPGLESHLTKGNGDHKAVNERQGNRPKLDDDPGTEYHTSDQRNHRSSGDPLVLPALRQSGILRRKTEHHQK